MAKNVVPKLCHSLKGGGIGEGSFCDKYANSYKVLHILTSTTHFRSGLLPPLHSRIVVHSIYALQLLASESAGVINDDDDDRDDRNDNHDDKAAMRHKERV